MVKSKDCDTVEGSVASKMLAILAEKKMRRNIFSDFAYMDER